MKRRYICSALDAAPLVALQLQATVGDFDASKMPAGFLYTLFHTGI